MRHSLVARLVPIFAIGSLLAGCSIIVDNNLSKYKEAPRLPLESSSNNANYLDLVFTLRDMKPHLSQKLEYRIVDGSNVVQSRGIIEPLPSLLTDVVDRPVVIHAPGAIPKSHDGYRLDFYADQTRDGKFSGLTGVTGDHAWRIGPELADYPEDPTVTDPQPDIVQVVFTHNTNFTDIDTDSNGAPNKAQDLFNPCKIHVVGADEFLTKLIQFRVVDSANKHVVGVWRATELAAGAFEILIPGVIDTNVDYDVEVYVDANKNKEFDDPAKGAGDLGWNLHATSDAAGLEFSVDLTQDRDKANAAVTAP